jgi:hypothetical protein
MKLQLENLERASFAERFFFVWWCFWLSVVDPNWKFLFFLEEETRFNG